MPLPTYAQSEKYETEGVLDFRHKDVTEGGETGDELPVRVAVAGTWCEFIIFFLSELLAMFRLMLASVSRSSPNASHRALWTI